MSGFFVLSGFKHIKKAKLLNQSIEKDNISIQLKVISSILQRLFYSPCVFLHKGLFPPSCEFN